MVTVGFADLIVESARVANVRSYSYCNKDIIDRMQDLVTEKAKYGLSFDIIIEEGALGSSSDTITYPTGIKSWLVALIGVCLAELDTEGMDSSLYAVEADRWNMFLSTHYPSHVVERSLGNTIARPRYRKIVGYGKIEVISR